MSERIQRADPSSSPLTAWKGWDWERWAPRTLMARASLIIVVPMLLVQVISTYIFYDNHWDTMSRRMAASLAGDVAGIAVFIKDFPGDPNLAWLKDTAKRTLMMDVTFDPGATLQAPVSNPSVVTDESDISNDLLKEALWEALKRPFQVDLATFRVDKQISIHVQLDNGVLHVLAPRRRLFSSTTYVFVIWMVGSSLLLFGVATVFLRNQVKAVRRLARAADEFGKGRDVPDFPAEGAFEVRQAARAFNIMRGRITRQIAQRTDMLSGVSHDLRTPLTRMKLQLEMMGRDVTPEDIAALKDDAADMERMLDAYLTFARGDGNEEAIAVNIAELLETVVSRFRRDGAAISLHLGVVPTSIPLRPIAFERCVNNLVGNAVRYAKTVEISAGAHGRMLEIHVDDDGPGIPPENREDVFRPFTRLETSRNPKTGGVGLGLTIALDIVRSLGGEIALGDSPKGGLRATIRIPL
ncbi:MAG: HAMP domain-containing protein [Rhodospirillaceae bacterium]|nr:HAMP domain-containing protein [Rhodospirillaceae bacterium]